MFVHFFGKYAIKLIGFVHNLFVDIAGEADFVVFMTDYENYAGIFTCQKILFGHTKSASILSRKPTLDKVIINQVFFFLDYPISKLISFVNVFNV